MHDILIMAVPVSAILLSAVVGIWFNQRGLDKLESKIDRMETRLESKIDRLQHDVSFFGQEQARHDIRLDQLEKAQ